MSQVPPFRLPPAPRAYRAMCAYCKGEPIRSMCVNCGAPQPDCRAGDVDVTRLSDAGQRLFPCTYAATVHGRHIRG